MQDIFLQTLDRQLRTPMIPRLSKNPRIAKVDIHHLQLHDQAIVPDLLNGTEPLLRIANWGGVDENRHVRQGGNRNFRVDVHSIFIFELALSRLDFFLQEVHQVRVPGRDSVGLQHQFDHPAKTGIPLLPPGG